MQTHPRIGVSPFVPLVRRDERSAFEPAGAVDVVGAVDVSCISTPPSGGERADFAFAATSCAIVVVMRRLLPRSPYARLKNCARELTDRLLDKNCARKMMSMSRFLWRRKNVFVLEISKLLTLFV